MLGLAVPPNVDPGRRALRVFRLLSHHGQIPTLALSPNTFDRGDQHPLAVPAFDNVIYRKLGVALETDEVGICTLRWPTPFTFRGEFDRAEKKSWEVGFRWISSAILGSEFLV